ncbi:hypothetical protein Ccrd_024386 [Cynara cardunculus var. scolymus]|uniref:Uncharacterized protein n=1 Tax=Cynara cardunculus var. scolymus TaxID=59895 RepID=A0A103CYJ1_CYNCS|nr:hypothetical protein Ccrd_024387 [Cynara cardunculus var. scolymus]KVD92196.1 hypothetical protein Ccrd_024386 [Cynara cardunculus var. scolymus]
MLMLWQLVLAIQGCFLLDQMGRLYYISSLGMPLVLLVINLLLHRLKSGSMLVMLEPIHMMCEPWLLLYP